MSNNSLFLFVHSSGFLLLDARVVRDIKEYMRHCRSFGLKTNHSTRKSYIILMLFIFYALIGRQIKTTYKISALPLIHQLLCHKENVHLYLHKTSSYYHFDTIPPSRDQSSLLILSIMTFTVVNGISTSYTRMNAERVTMA